MLKAGSKNPNGINAIIFPNKFFTEILILLLLNKNENILFNDIKLLWVILKLNGATSEPFRISFIIGVGYLKSTTFINNNKYIKNKTDI